MDISNKIRFLHDKDNKKVAVQMDIDVFEAIEDYIEDEVLLKLMLESKEKKEEYLSLDQAIEYYNKLPEVE